MYVYYTDKISLLSDGLKCQIMLNKKQRWTSRYEIGSYCVATET
jgi:hypothetical protein